MATRETVNVCFGLELNKALVASDLRIADLQRRLEAADHSVSINHLSDLTHSERGPSPELINAIVKVMRLSKEARLRMHRAAALDRGYEIGVL